MPCARPRPPRAPTLMNNPRRPARRATVKLLPSGLRDDELGGSAIRRPHNLEVPADPLTDGAGELDLRSLEPDRPDDRRVLAGRDVVADRLAVDAHLLDRRLHDLEPGPAMGARPAIGLLLEARHVGLEERLRGRARLHAPRSDTADTVGVGAHNLLVEREGGADRGEEDLRVEADLLRLLRGEDRVRRVGEPDERVRV